MQVHDFKGNDCWKTFCGCLYILYMYKYFFSTLSYQEEEVKLSTMDSFCECVGNSSVSNGHDLGREREQIFLDRDVVIAAYCRNVYVDSVTAATLKDWLLSVWSSLPLRQSEYYVLGLKPMFLPHPAVWLPFSYFPGGLLLIGTTQFFLLPLEGCSELFIILIIILRNRRRLLDAEAQNFVNET